MRSIALYVGMTCAIVAGAGLPLLNVFASDSKWNVDRVSYDRKSPTLVRCFFDRNEKKSVFFKWNRSDFFKRKISYAITPVPSCRTPVGLYRDLPPTALTTGLLEGRELPETIVRQLRLIERGATVVDDANSKSDYLVLGPTDEYTTETNRTLTARYGAEFSTKTFEHWLNSFPKNQDLRERLHDELKSAIATETAGKKLEPLAKPRSKVIFMVSLGLGWSDDISDQSRPDVEKSVTSLISASGYPIEFIHRDSYGTVEEVGTEMAGAIYKHLSKGENVALIGLSQGTPEILIAEAIAARRVKMRTDTAGFGRILGVLSFSGISNGTFLASIPNKIPRAEKITRLGEKIPIRKVSDLAKTLHSVAGLDEATVQGAVAKYASDLPADAVYLNLCGIESDFGLPSPTAQKEIMQVVNLVQKFHWVHSANDGMADYPTLMPKAISSTQYAVAVHGTHYIFDGEFDGIDLTTAVARKVLLKVIFGEFLNLYEVSYGKI